MQGALISIAIAIATLASSAAVAAAETTRRPACPKVEPQRAPNQAQPQPQQRVRAPECRTTRSIPPLVDPLPFFLL